MCIAGYFLNVSFNHLSWDVFVYQDLIYFSEMSPVCVHVSAGIIFVEADSRSCFHSPPLRILVGTFYWDSHFNPDGVVITISQWFFNVDRI